MAKPALSPQTATGGLAPPLLPAMTSPCAAWVGAFPGARVPSRRRSTRAVCHRARRGAATRVAPAAVGAPAGDAGRLAADAAAAAARQSGACPEGPAGQAAPPSLPWEATDPLAAASTASCPQQADEDRAAAEVATGNAHPRWPLPPTVEVSRLLWLGATQTPGFWRFPLGVLATAAAAAGSPDVLTVTMMGRPLVTAVLSAPAVAAALAAPSDVLTAEPMHLTMGRTFEVPASAYRSAAEAAEAVQMTPAAMEVLNAHFRQAVTHTWWWSTPDLHERLDRAIEAKLAAIVGPSGDATVDLFETFSQLVVTAMLAVFVGDTFAASYGSEVAVAFREWERAAWTLPWILAPLTARRLHPEIEPAYARAFQPILDAVTAVMEGEEAVQPGTYLHDMLTTLDQAGQMGMVRPAHVAKQVISALLAAHINTHVSGAWTVAHVAAHPDLTAAAAAEVAAADAGRPPPVAAAGRSPTGLPVMEAVWAEALRCNAVAPAIRGTRAPFHVAASAAAGGAAGGGDGQPGWTVPGGGHLVLLSPAHANTGADYYGEAAGDVDPHRFVPPATPSWQAAESDRRLLMFGGGVHVCIGRRVAEDILGRMWRALYRSQCRVELVGCEGGLPPADFLRAGSTAMPTRPVHVRLTLHGEAEH